MQQYKKLAQGLKGQIASLIPANENIYDTIKQNPQADYYVSLFKYNQSHFDEFKKTKSVAGIRGLTTNKILFDFDSGSDLEKAQKDAVITCNRLIKAGIAEDKIQVFYSGSKGFHVGATFNEEMNRQQFVNITHNMAADLPTFDTKISDEARVIRAPLTKHPKSSLYKIPLSVEDLKTMSVTEIQVNAVDATHYDPADLDDKHWITSIPPKVIELRNKEYKKVGVVEIKESIGFDVNDIDFSKAPKWMAKERFCLQEGYFRGSSSGKGERNSAFMILSATYKAQGFSADHALALLMTTADKQAQRTGEDPYTEDQMKREIISSVYSPSFKGGIYGKDEELLVVTRERFNLHETEEAKAESVKISNVGDTFKSFAKNIDRNIVKTGLKSLDDQVMITSGMMVSLLAAPGAGKTSFANLFVENLSKSGENSIFFSMDMYENLLFSRLLQRYSGYDMRKILEMFKADKPDQTLLDAYTNVLKNYNNASFNFRSGPTVEQIEQEVIDFQQQTGKPVKLIVVDYLEKVRGPFADATANSAYVASRLSDIAKKHHCVVMLLVQPQKSAGDPRDELNSYRKIKGASVIEQDSRVVLTLSRPGYNPKDMSDDKYATISVVKNNMGGMGQIDFGWEGVSGSFTELDSSDRSHLAALRKELAEEKAANDKAWDI